MPAAFARANGPLGRVALTRSTGPAVGGWRYGTARGPTTAVRTAPAAAAVAAGLTPCSSSALAPCSRGYLRGERQHGHGPRFGEPQAIGAPAVTDSTCRDGIGP